MNQHHVNVSVIVPMYNADEYVQETIESLLSQTLTDIEILLIDDCSTDNTYHIAAHYAALDPRIVLQRQQQNQGVSVARNTALDMSKGEYIFFIDADDKIAVDTLEAMYTAAVEKGADLVTGVYERFDSKSYSIMTFFHQFPDLLIEGYKQLSDSPELLYSVYSCGKLIKKSLLDGVYYPLDLTFAEDHLVTVTLMLKAEKIYNLSKTVYQYRLREKQSESATQSIYRDPVNNLSNLIKVVNSIQKQFAHDIANRELRDTLFSSYMSRVLHWNIWTSISNGILSLNFQNRLSVLELYYNWLHNLEKATLLKNKKDFEIIHDRIGKLKPIMDAKTKLLYTNFSI